MKVNLLKYIVLLFLPIVLHSQTSEKELDKCSWKFRKVKDKLWYKATIPGTIHTDLFANKLIQDPFHGDNEKKLQWIENEDWEYAAILKISKGELTQSHIELQFDGLDTYAKVYVNDSLVLIADNMFRSWNVDVKKYLHKGENKLNIVFESAVKRGKEEAKKISYTLPGDERVFTRKAQYQYGWDWGPRFVTCGIWKDVKLLAWSGAKIENVKCIQKSLTDSLAKLDFECEIKCDSAGKYDLFVCKALDEKTKNFSFSSKNKIDLKKGINIIHLEYLIKNPEKCWCNGLGAQKLYDFTVLLAKEEMEFDETQMNVGLRTIELVQDKDSIGSSFYFRLNGVPVFMKGANCIPPDNFLPRVTKNDYETIVNNAVDANMNMLRVWGGGVYADDAFYNDCDKKGILVWQDFMFACAMYPGDDHFVNNVAEEVIDQTERLRNHPCIALWCGNNEVDEGWKNWEWQKQYHYSEKDSTTIAQNNSALFDNLMKDLVTTYDGSRAYWPSSPGIGWGHKESLEQGDSHYWGVWWGNEPFETYEKKVGRFVSEYGFQGMPNFKAFIKMGVYDKKPTSSQQDLKYSAHNNKTLIIPGLDSVSFKNHQKNPAGYETIGKYMERDYKNPNNFENYIYVSQLLQAEGMKTAIEAHRRAKPYCMGTLYWQLNDCWPVTSWSSVDYYNNWKASHYEVKRAFQNILVSIEEKENKCDIYIVSDLQKSADGMLRMKLFNLKGDLLWSKELLVHVDSNSSKVFYQFEKSILKNYNLNEVVLKSSFTHMEGKYTEYKASHYFVKPKELFLQKAKVSFSLSEADHHQSIVVSSSVFVKDVFISIKGESVNLSDNYFDLLPGEIKTVYLPETVHISGLQKKVRVSSLTDTY